MTAAAEMAVPFDPLASEQAAEALRMVPIEGLCAELVRRAGRAASLAADSVRLAEAESTPLGSMLEYVSCATHAADRATRLRDAVHALAPDSQYATDASACSLTAKLAAERCHIIRAKLFAQYQGGRA